jgi:hypothetical protein
VDCAGPASAIGRTWRSSGHRIPDILSTLEKSWHKPVHLLTWTFHEQPTVTEAPRYELCLAREIREGAPNVQFARE